MVLALCPPSGDIDPIFIGILFIAMIVTFIAMARDSERQDRAWGWWTGEILKNTYRLPSDLTTKPNTSQQDKEEDNAE
jgi:hypothetical protein